MPYRYSCLLVYSQKGFLCVIQNVFLSNIYMYLFCASDENFFVQKEFLFPKELGKVAAEP